MAITTALCNSFKQEILNGEHTINGSNTLKVALIKATPTGTYNADTTNYSDVTGNSDEASGTGYTSTGKSLTSVTVSVDNTNDIAYVDFANVNWTSSSISADGCIIYNTATTPANKAVAVIDFGGTKTSTNGDFVIEFPDPATPTDAIIVIS